MANELYVVDETDSKNAKGFALANVTGFELEERSSGGVDPDIPPVLLLRIELAGGRVARFSGDAARDLYKELRKLAIVV